MPILFLILGLTIRNDVGLEGNYSNFRYTITDTTTRDTTVPNTELHSYWSAYLNHKRSDYEIQTNNNLRFSTASLDNSLNFSLTSPLNSFMTFKGAANGELCYYHDYFPSLQDTVLRASYFNANLKFNLQFQPTKKSTIGISENIEHQHYLPPSSFYSNYYLNRIKVEYSTQFSDISSLIFDSGLYRLWNNTQPEKNYTEYNLYLNWNSYFARDWNLQFDNFLNRRVYSERTRSFLELEPSLLISRELGSVLQINLTESPRLDWFDETTSVYQNQFTNQLGLELEIRPNNSLIFRLKPQSELLQSWSQVSYQDYYEISLSLAMDLISSTRFSVTIEDRLGERRYLLNDSAFQSNYRFNEFNLSGSWTILHFPQSELRLQLMLNISPEWHYDAIDNLATVTSSIQLQYSW